MIPNYLDDLQLPSVFAAFCSDVDSYVHEAQGDKHIVDSDAYHISGFVSPVFGKTEEIAQKYFAVEDISSSPYALIQIDNAIIKSTTTKKCDCVVANRDCFCLIEFKTNAFSDNKRVIENNYRTAIAQIEATMAIFISFFAGIGVDFRTIRSVEAFICFRRGYPRNTSSQMNYQVAFAAANGGVPLSFSRKKII